MTDPAHLTVQLAQHEFGVGGPSCFAYMSFATQDVTIDELEPPMEIAAGFAMQGALTLFGGRMGFKMSFVGTQLSMDLSASPLKLFGDLTQVCWLLELAIWLNTATFGRCTELQKKRQMHREEEERRTLQLQTLYNFMTVPKDLSFMWMQIWQRRILR